LNKKISQHFT